MEPISREVSVQGCNITTSLFGHTSRTGGQVNKNNNNTNNNNIKLFLALYIIRRIDSIYNFSPCEVSVFRASTERAERIHIIITPVQKADNVIPT